MKFLEAVILCSFSSLLLVGVAMAQDITEVITESDFEQMLLHRNDVACPARGFYTYDAFIEAARFYPSFGNTGDLEIRRREVAAFFGQTSQETTGGWDTAPDGRYAWGYCFNKETPVPGGCCVANAQWPCVQGQTYCGRGPIQLTYNFNYGPAGEALGLDLLANPDLVSSDTVISFEAALWFWMTPQPPKPSCHDVIIGQWTPSQADINAGRVPGYGVITNIINGGIECGRGQVPQMLYRIGFYQRFCGILGTSTGGNLDCANQRPFGNVLVKDQPAYSSFPIEMVVA